MEFSKEEIWHIRQVMRERGISHCQECREIEKKLSDVISEKVE